MRRLTLHPEQNSSSTEETGPIFDHEGATPDWSPKEEWLSVPDRPEAEENDWLITYHTEDSHDWRIFRNRYEAFTFFLDHPNIQVITFQLQPREIL